MQSMSSLKEKLEPIEVQINCTSRIRKWAYDNAYTLIFLAVFFMITWVVIVMSNYVFGR